MINLQPYTNPRYFIILFIALLPLIIGLYNGKRYKNYEAFISFLFLFLMFSGSEWIQGVQIIGYVIFQFLITFLYQKYLKKREEQY